MNWGLFSKATSALNIRAKLFEIEIEFDNGKNSEWKLFSFPILNMK